MDPGTGLTVLGTAIGSAKLVEKILGPTAEYLGGGIRDWTERSVNNVGRIFQKASKKLGDKLEAPGAVPPKVLKSVLENGAFCDDELTAEYYGGVLASSRSEVGRDDRGAALLALLERLTSYQVRSHFFFYTMLKLLYDGIEEVNIGVAAGRNSIKTFVPLGAYSAAMEFSEKEPVAPIISHVMFGLAGETLIEENFVYGPSDDLKRHFSEADGPGIVFAPAARGVELFLWAHGRGELAIQQFLEPEVVLRSGIKISTTPGVRSVKYSDRRYPRPEPTGSQPPAKGDAA